MARSLASHHTLIPIHTSTSTPIHIHTHNHTHTHTHTHIHIFRLHLTRISTNTCIYLTHHSPMLVFSSLLFLVCLVFVHKAKAMARFLFQASGLCFNRSLSPKLMGVSRQHRPEVIPVKVRIPRLGQFHYLQEQTVQASLLFK